METEMLKYKMLNLYLNSNIERKPVNNRMI